MSCGESGGDFKRPPRKVRERHHLVYLHSCPLVVLQQTPKGERVPVPVGALSIKKVAKHDFACVPREIAMKCLLFLLLWLLFLFLLLLLLLLLCVCVCVCVCVNSFIVCV